MPVEVKEFFKIRDIKGVEHEGLGVANELVAIEKADGEFVYGKAIELVKLQTKVTCDLGSDCTKGKIDEAFVTHPKVIEFEDTGKGEFIKDVAEVVICTDYKGARKVFCSYECSAKFYRKAEKYQNVIEFPSGKGKRTFEPKGSVVLGTEDAGNKN